MLIAYQDATKTSKVQLAAKNVRLVNMILGMYLREIHQRSVKSVSLLFCFKVPIIYDFSFLTIRFVYFSVDFFLFLQARLDITRQQTVLPFVFRA